MVPNYQDAFNDKCDTVQTKQAVVSVSTCNYQESKEHNYIFERVAVSSQSQDSSCASDKAGQRLRMCTCESQLLLEETPRG